VGATAVRLDLFDGLCTTRGLAAMYDDVRAIPRELKRDRTTDTLLP
jgi:hypothetical protein